MSSNSASLELIFEACSVAERVSFVVGVGDGVFCLVARLLEAAGVLCLSLLHSVSDPEELVVSGFLGQVRALCPVSPHMLHFLDIVSEDENFGLEKE